MIDWLVNDLASVALTIAAVTGLAWKIVKPHLEKYVLEITEDHAKRLDKLEEGQADLNEKKERDYKWRLTSDKQMRALLKANLVMLLHMRDQNHTGEMDKVIKDLQETVIDS